MKKFGMILTLLAGMLFVPSLSTDVSLPKKSCNPVLSTLISTHEFPVSNTTSEILFTAFVLESISGSDAALEHTGAICPSFSGISVHPKHSFEKCQFKGEENILTEVGVL